MQTVFEAVAVPLMLERQIKVFAQLLFGCGATKGGIDQRLENGFGIVAIVPTLALAHESFGGFLPGDFLNVFDEPDRPGNGHAV